MIFILLLTRKNLLYCAMCIRVVLIDSIIKCNMVEIGNYYVLIAVSLLGLGRFGVCSKICLCTFAAVFEEDVCASFKSEVFDLLCFGYILLIQLDGGWALLIKLTRLFGYRKLPRSKI